MFRLGKSSFFAFLILCSTPLFLSSCSESDDPDPISTIKSYLRIWNSIDNDELKGDVDIYQPQSEDFERLNKKVLANPNNASIFRNRGRAYYYSELPNHYELALADYNKALSLFAWNANWYSERSSVLGQLEKHEEALKDINKAIQLDGHEPMFYSNRATIYEDLGKPEEAFKDTLKAAKLEKPARLYSIYLAKALAKRGQENEALDVLNKVIANSDEYWTSDAHEERIAILMAQGKFDQVQKEVAEWKDETPPSSSAFKCSAKLAEAMGSPEKARLDYQELVKLSTTQIDETDSKSIMQFEQRADCFEKLGQPKKAAEDRRKALALYEEESKECPSREPDNLGYMALLCEKLGDNKKALELRAREISKFNALVAKSPKSADAYHDRALILEPLKKYDLAMRDFAQAMALEPNDNHFIGHHAGCLNHLKRYQQALDECQKGLKTSSHYSEFLFVPMAEASQQLGKPEDAVDYATRRIKLDPTVGDAYYWRSLAYQKLGKNDLAKRDLIFSKWYDSESDE